ncbi:hypothetical protein BDF20DRAFT_879022, partial [Mycotypha africana]|uniref:uncharacterized protein n=1 Tax=Mycotypha africana TaxID=64632 RepID=UPI0023008B33
MYKAIILQKIKLVAEAHKNKVKDKSFLSIECKDCKTRGHFNKAYHECKFYKAVSARDEVAARNISNQLQSRKKKSKQRERRSKHISCDLK